LFLKRKGWRTMARQRPGATGTPYTAAGKGQAGWPWVRKVKRKSSIELLRSQVASWLFAIVAVRLCQSVGWQRLLARLGAHFRC
jgi:hypothetical protein